MNKNTPPLLGFVGSVVVSKLSLAALTASCGNGNGSGNWCNDGNWNGHWDGSLKTTKRLGLVGRDCGCNNRKEGDEGELVHVGFVFCIVLCVERRLKKIHLVVL